MNRLDASIARDGGSDGAGGGGGGAGAGGDTVDENETGMGAGGENETGACAEGENEAGAVLCPHVSGLHQDRKVFVPYL